MTDPITETYGACPECDLLYRRLPLALGDAAYCPRCGGKLYSRSRISPSQLLGLVVGALLVYMIANTCPIVELHIQGQRNSATLFGSVQALWSEGRKIMAVLVFATTQLFPLIDLLITLALLSAVSVRSPQYPARQYPFWFSPLLRFISNLRPWGMIEVFMLGVIVALVKLSHIAHVLPGVALWAFGALTILLAVILSLDLRTLWDQPVHE